MFRIIFAASRSRYVYFGARIDHRGLCFFYFISFLFYEFVYQLTISVYKKNKFIIKGLLKLYGRSLSSMVCDRFCKPSARGSHPAQPQFIFGAHQSKVTTIIKTFR